MEIGLFALSVRPNPFQIAFYLTNMAIEEEFSVLESEEAVARCKKHPISKRKGGVVKTRMKVRERETRDHIVGVYCQDILQLSLRSYCVHFFRVPRW